MGEKQDWQITALFLEESYSRRCWQLLGPQPLRVEAEIARGGFMFSTICFSLCYEAYNNGTAVVSYKSDTERDGGTRSII